MTIRYLKVFRNAGQLTTIGARADFAPEKEAEFVSGGMAEYLYVAPPQIGYNELADPLSRLTRSANLAHQRWGRRPMVNGLHGSETGAREFRRVGGKVVAYYYSQWRQFGNTYNRWPWKWLVDYPDRLPLLSTPLPSKQLWPLNYMADGFTVTNATWALVGYSAFSADYASWVATYATLSVSAGVATLTATGSSPSAAILESPTLSVPCDDIAFIRVRVELTTVVPGTTWKGLIYYATAASPTYHWTKTLQIAEPVSTTGIHDIIVPIPAGQLNWLGGVLTNLRIDLWSGVGTVMKLHAFLGYRGYVRMTATTTDPVLYSPSQLGLAAADYKTAVIEVRKVSGTTWDGRFFWITDADTSWNVGKSMTLTEPSWDGKWKTLTVDLSAKAEWTGTIRQFRWDLGASADFVVDARNAELRPIAGSVVELVQNQTMGLDSDDQNGVDWEIRTAYGNGIDVFAHNYSWSSVIGFGNGNHQKNALDRHACSAAEPNMKFCVQWSNLEAANPFSTAADINPMLDEWNTYFRFSRYWKIGGKPVVFIFLTSKLKEWAATLWSIPADNDAVKRFLDEMDAYLAALPGSYAPQGVYWVAQEHSADPVMTGRALGYVGTNEYAGFDAGTRYAFFSYWRTIVQNSSGGTTADVYPSAIAPLASFAQLREAYLGSARWVVRESGSRLPYWYPVLAGWDGRPWLGYKNLTAPPTDYSTISSPEEFAAALRDARDFTLANLAAMQSPEGPVVTIYAWNEYGEGGFIAPTRRYHFQMCEAVLRVFGHAEG